MTVRVVLAALVTTGFFGCGGTDDAQPEPDPFTESAAREALRAFYAADDPRELCSFLTKHAEAQLVEAAAVESFPDAHTCTEQVRAMASSGSDPRLGPPLTAEEQEEIRQPAELDPETETAAFLDEFRAGVVLRFVDDEWKVAGVATGG